MLDVDVIIIIIIIIIIIAYLNANDRIFFVRVNLNDTRRTGDGGRRRKLKLYVGKFVSDVLVSFVTVKLETEEDVDALAVVCRDQGRNSGSVRHVPLTVGELPDDTIVDETWNDARHPGAARVRKPARLNQQQH